MYVLLTSQSPNTNTACMYTHASSRLEKYCRGGDQLAQREHREIGSSPRVMVQHARMVVDATSCYHGTTRMLF